MRWQVTEEWAGAHMPPTLEAIAIPMTKLCTGQYRHMEYVQTLEQDSCWGLLVCCRKAMGGRAGGTTCCRDEGVRDNRGYEGTWARSKHWPERTLPSMGLLCSRRRIGCTRAKHSTGAATLEIHMLENVAMNIEARTTWRGRLTRAMMLTAAAFAMKCFDSAAAIAKPPSSSMITDENMTCTLARACHKL